MKQRRSSLFRFYGLDPLVSSNLDLTSETMNPFRHLVGLLGRGIGHRKVSAYSTTQKTSTYIRDSSGIRTSDSSDGAVRNRLRGRWIVC
jgi:hypothetical protein